MKLALISSLVSPIREPQCGGAQSFLADLSKGLARRGHAVDVFAGSGSEIDGVRVVDVGIEAQLERLAHPLDIGAPAEDFALAGQHDRAHVVCRRDPRKNVVQTLDCLGIEGVAGLGP